MWSIPEKILNTMISVTISLINWQALMEMNIYIDFMSPFWQLSVVNSQYQSLSTTHHADAVGRHPDIYRRDSPFTHQ